MALIRKRGMTGMTGVLDITSPRMLLDAHLLLVPSTVTVQDVGELVRARVRGSDMGTSGVVRLGRHSRLLGPFELTMEDAVDAGVPMPWTVTYAFQAPIEREDPPQPGVDDRDGFADAFPDGLPWREEGRGLHLLVALARRLRGAVRVTGGRMINPDPDRAVDVVVHSRYWIEPDVLLKVVSRALPTARLAVEGEEWEGPPPEVYSGAVIREHVSADVLDTAELIGLQALADDHDLANLRQEDVIDGYALVGEVGAHGQDGAVEVLVHVADPEEPSVADEDWAAHPFVSYEVRWSCPEPDEREHRAPSESYVQARERVRPVISAVARTVVEAAAGVVTDEDGFWLDRYSL
ncbi:MAG: hypothetical protein ACXV1K_02865 [Kineosporiaceae bacterium]